jgi:putative phosphoesterase
MRILVLSDIHANWPALQAIQEPHDVCICLGDLVDYGPQPVECVRWAMEHADYIVRGNHDHGVAQDVEVLGERGYRYLTRISRKRMWPLLGHEERSYLLRLPLTLRVTLQNRRFYLVHATPRDPLDEYVTKEPEAWLRRVGSLEADIVCVGHTHMQFNLMAGNTVVLNPGTVGQARDGDPRAAYAVIEDGRIELKRQEYPVEQTIAAMDATNLPEKAKQLYAEALRLGRLPSVPPPEEEGDDE